MEGSFIIIDHLLLVDDHFALESSPGVYFIELVRCSS
jgi:hypothetical protein